MPMITTIEQVICAEQRHTCCASKPQGCQEKMFQKPRNVPRLRRGVHLVMVRQMKPPVLWKAAQGVEGNHQEQLTELLPILARKPSIQMADRISMNGRNCLVPFAVGVVRKPAFYPRHK